MKRLLRVGLFLALGVALLSVSALAVDGGIYDVQVESGYADTVTVTPQTAAGETVTATETEIDGTAASFYEGAEKVQVTYTGGDSASYYLLLALNDKTSVPTADNIVYIDQAAGGIAFTVYPSSLEAGKTYNVYLSSNDGTLTGLTKVASFQYYVPYTPGDVNEDKTININDAMAVINHIIGKDILTGNNWTAAEVTGDGLVNINDAMEIINYIIGKPEYLGK